MTSLLGRICFFGIAGLVVAMPLDALHVVTGVLSYATPRAWMPFGLQDWWVIPLYVGAGIVKGSDPRAEDRETELKARTMLSALGV